MYNRAFVGLVLSFAVSGAQAALINGDFSSGLTGWTGIGNTSVSAGQEGQMDSSGGVTSFSGINSALNIDLAALTNAYLGGSHTTSSASVLYQSFTVSGVGELSFDWQFMTNESTVFPPPVSHPDYAFYVLMDIGTGLAQVSDTSSGAPAGFTNSDSGSVTVSGLSAGTYLIAFGVVNVDGNTVNSALRVDDVLLDDVIASSAVPVPATVAMLGLGLMGMRRRS